jgi:hypothetical protein
MKKLLLFLGALAAYAQTVSLSDTLTNAVGGGSFTGRVTVTLNAPGNASPLYYSTTSLTGWQAVYCLGVTGADCTTTTSAGTFAAALYANSTITPAGTSYSARFQPAKGAAWSEVWTVEAADTKLYQIRATAVPSPTVMFQPSQLAAGGASNGNCLVYDGTTWEPAACASGGGSGTVTSVAATVPSILAVTGSPITTSGTLAISLATQTANQVFAGPTSGGAATPTFRALVSADIPANAANTSGNAATATALAANGTNCTAGSYPLGVDASGNAEGCTVASGGGGTVSSVSVTTANGVSGSVANATTTPAITLTLGAITPSSVAAVGTVTGSNLSGTNTGDQTTISGNAGTATALAANGANCSAGQFPLGVDASGAAENCTALPTTIAGTANQITASASTGAITLSIPTSPTLPGTTTGTFSGNLTGNVTGNVSGSSGSTTGNAATATALAANGANCSAGNFPLGVDASGASETCTALPTTISGTANEITASASTGAVTLSLPSTVNLSSKTLRVPNGIFLPGACTVGDSYMDTDATTGSRWYLCESTNTWVAQGGGSVAPGPDTLYSFEEDFLYWSTSSGAKGEKTWWNTSGSNANSGFYEATIADHPGVPRLAVLDTGNHQLYWGGSSNRFNFDATQNWIFLVRADGTTSDYVYQCGVSTDPETHPSSDEVVIEKASADTTWFYRTRASSTSSTRVNSTASVTTGWLALKLRKSGSTWYFSTASTIAGLTGATELSIATNIPTGTYRPFCYNSVGGSVTGWHGLELDYVRGQLTISR